MLSTLAKVGQAHFGLSEYFWVIGTAWAMYLFICKTCRP